MFRWILESAKQGDVTAQHVLASIYLRGQIKKRNRELAYAWAGVASAGGFLKSRSLRNNIETVMTDKEISAARIRARDLWERHGNKNEHGKPSPST